MSGPIRRHEAHASEGVAQDYHCAHCGWEGEAGAMGSGVSVRAAQFGDDGEEAAQSARGMAIMEALDHIRLAPCPRCDKRQPGALLKVFAPRLGAVLVIVGLLTAVGVFFAKNARAPWFTPAFAFGGLGIASPRILALLRLARGQGALSFLETD